EMLVSARTFPAPAGAFGGVISAAQSQPVVAGEGATALGLSRPTNFHPHLQTVSHAANRLARREAVKALKPLIHFPKKFRAGAAIHRRRQSKEPTRGAPDERG